MSNSPGTDPGRGGALGGAGWTPPRDRAPGPRMRVPGLAGVGFREGLVAITLAGLVLRLVRLGHQSLWIDEVLSVSWIQEIQTRGFGSLWTNLHGPVHALAIYCMNLVSPR